MTSPATPPYPLGQAMGTTCPAFLKGHQSSHADLDYEATGVRKTLSAQMIDAVIVKQTGASAIAPGSLVKWSVPGTEIAAVAGANEVPCGVVDPYLTASVAQNEYCWVIQSGPCNVLSSAAIAANAPITTAASGKSVTSSYTTEQAVAGRQIDEATDADQLRRTLVCCSNI